MNSYTSLEPGFSQSIGIPSVGGVTSLLASTSFIYSLLIISCIGATAFVYLRGGLWRMQGTPASISKSNAEFKRGTLGLLGVLLLFLLLFTLNKDLLTGNVGLEGLRSIVGIKTPAVATGGDTVPTNQQTGDQSWLDAIKEDPTVRDQLSKLSGGGISVNKAVCGSPSQTGCTTVGGWPSATLSMLSQLRSTCSGNIQVTGGTEAGHSSHGPGRTPVDLGIGDSTLNSCISKFASGPNLGFCKKTYTNFGFIFCDENNANPHWHVFK